MGAWISFGLLAVALVGPALMVVRSRDLVHSVLWLALTLVSTAVAYVVLHADFLAAVQVLLYTGGIVTLMLFAIMLTRRLEGRSFIEHGSSGRLRAALAAAAVLGLTITAVLGTLPFSQGGPTPQLPVDTAALGRIFLGPLVLPFELLSVLLLAAMIGAITLARRDEPSKRPVRPARPAPPSPLEGAHHE